MAETRTSTCGGYFSVCFCAPALRNSPVMREELLSGKWSGGASARSGDGGAPRRLPREQLIEHGCRRVGRGDGGAPRVIAYFLFDIYDRVFHFR
ncbi:hypothetical protein NDU88_006215 [Pleurodeles waltl]|uniref:Uncharacterized protein n=1 Tax=Pleurodeles waltl TaxID=8319 RepID=A0AAV7X056_PLEWA|nr:hypothetical protein NDU88_006215 [Pleurodeles waltl]